MLLEHGRRAADAGEIRDERPAARTRGEVPLELVVFLGVFPAIAALAGVVLGQRMESSRDTKAHARTIEQVALADRSA